MEFDTLLPKGTRAMESISFVVVKADLRQKPGVILKQELAELTVAEVVDAMSFQHTQVVISCQAVTAPTVLPGLLELAGPQDQELAQVQLPAQPRAGGLEALVVVTQAQRRDGQHHPLRGGGLAARALTYTLGP